MLRFDIGKYTYSASPGRDYYCLYPSQSPSDLDDSIKSYDHMLHQSLDKIFRERCLSSSVQIKEFLRKCRRNTDQKSIIKQILEPEAILSRYFSKKELGKLSLLWIAVLAGYNDSAELLVRSGANVKEKFGSHDPLVIDKNWTIIHLLLHMDSSPENDRFIRLVVDHGRASLQARDYKGRTALHIAVMKGRVQMAEMLLQKGANVNVADNDRMTPLLAAVINAKGNELLPLLLIHGADIFAKNVHGESRAMHLLAYAPVEHAVDLARVLVEKGVPVEGKQEFFEYEQPIHLAAQIGNNELVKFYLDHGANANPLNEIGDTPLSIAAQYGRDTVVETLLERGANVHLRSIRRFEGRTALHAACRYAALPTPLIDKNRCEIIVRLLLSAGADVLVEDNSSKTPFALMSARENGDQPGEESRPLIEVLALKKVLQPSIELKDEQIIKRFPKLWNYHRKCTDEIDSMKSTRFVETCTFFQLLAKSQCQIAALMRNPAFETEFKRYDLSGFYIYADEIRRAFERAQNHYRSIVKQEEMINEALYNILPHLVVEKVVHYIFNCCGNVK